MSSTRHQTTPGPLRQERYASSPEIERGLLASAVARRCSVLDERADRELIWWLHFMSHQPGGLKALVTALLTSHSERIGTLAMSQISKRVSHYTADHMREIRKGLPREVRRQFLLKGEAVNSAGGIVPVRDALSIEALLTDEGEHRISKSAQLPSCYPVLDLTNLCRQAAESGMSHNCTHQTEGLEDFLRRICLDPGTELAACAPWYFADLIPTLRVFMSSWIARRAAGIVVTALGRKVHETLDYTLHSRTMTLMEGDARTGKSFAARFWCEQHPGQARFIEVPTGNDDAGFFRALARGLGLGSFQQYKASEIRERVEGVLLTGDLLLCLDESHRLWPEVNLWRGFPKRINWVMSMANQGVPICMVATPQFIERQRTSEQIAGWNSAQFLGRLGHYESLPRELALDDLMDVAKFVLPEADKPTLRALAAYARTSARYLAAIDTIAKRARYIAGREGRDTASTADVRKAMTESVVPSDSKIAVALQSPSKPRQRNEPSAPANRLPKANAPAPVETLRSVTPRQDADEIAMPASRLTGSTALLVAKE